jgi:hypothetical protein
MSNQPSFESTGLALCERQMIINNNKINIKKKINKISIGYFMNIIDIEKRKEEFIKYLTTFKNVINIYHIESLSL